MPTAPSPIADRLRDELGDAVTFDPAALEASRADKSGWVAAGMPLAVVNARSVAEVQAVMRLASEYGCASWHAAWARGQGVSPNPWGRDLREFLGASYRFPD